MGVKNPYTGDWSKPVRAKRTELTEQQESFLDWLTNPEQEGTLADQAPLIGVHAATLSHWKQEPYFIKRWEQRLRDLNVSPERTQILMDRTFNIASGGGKDADALKAIELYMRLVDRISPQRIAIEVEQVASEMTLEQLADAALALRGQVVETTAWPINTAAELKAELARDLANDV